MKQNGLIAMLFAIAMYVLMTACAVLMCANMELGGIMALVFFIPGTISAFVGIYQAYVQAKSLKGQKSIKQDKETETDVKDGETEKANK